MFVLLIFKYQNIKIRKGGRDERGDKNDDLRHGF